MKTTVLLLLLTSACFSQNDTIVKKNSKSITCTITLVNEGAVFYKDKKDNGDQVLISDVAYYSQSGKRTYVNNIANMRTDSVLISDELNYLKRCLVKSHQEYCAGIGVIGLGIAGTVGVGLADIEDKNILLLFTSGISLVGTIIVIDSHKWFKRAGLGINKNGIGVKYIFK